MTDRTEKQIELRAPVSRVWQALTDHRQFGEWFRVNLDSPFAEGQVSRGNITYPGYEHLKWESVVQQIEPERLFSFTWPDPKSMERAEYSPDYSNAPRTLVEFSLEPTKNGTLLRITESGFDQLPADRREQAFHANDAGWSEQLKNIEAYLARAA